MSRRILFIVEGGRAEPRFLKKVLRSYDIAEEHQIFSIETNIHIVYDRLFSNEDEDTLDVLTTLKEYASEKDRLVLSEKYSDIYLVFDAEIQDPKWNPNKIRRMLQYFDNPTENGLLLLNYPMFESIRHMSSPGDKGYLRSMVTVEQAGSYKSIVGSEGCLELRDPNRYDKRIIDLLLRMNVWKLGIILGRDPSRPDYTVYSADSLLALFYGQCSSLNEDGRIYVINTSVMIILEFISKDIFEEDTQTD